MLNIATILIMATSVTFTLALSDLELMVLHYMKLRIEERKLVYKITADGIPNHDFGPFFDEKTGEEIEMIPNPRRFKIPRYPQPNQVPKCLNSGPIGIAVNGIPFYQPYTKRGFDAGNYLSTDKCNGHVDHKGRYHYHMIPLCLFNPNATNQFLGVAMDGYPIYGPIDENGEMIRSEDLDICHGRLENGLYVYRATFDFPYILGCYQGRTLTKTSGHCMVALHRNPALEGTWKKRPGIEDEDNGQMLSDGKHSEPVDVNSKKFVRMGKKIMTLLINRN